MSYSSVQEALIRPVGHLLPRYPRGRRHNLDAPSPVRRMGEGGHACKLAPQARKQWPDEGLFAKLTKVVSISIVLLALNSPSFAVEPDEILKDPMLETRARELSAGFRCLVCQNQSIDDSDAPLAKDLRLLIREHLVRGETDGEIVEYVTGRYGDFVLLKPRFDMSTLLLWMAPFTVLLLGLAALLRRRPAEAEPELPLSEAERREFEQGD